MAKILDAFKNDSIQDAAAVIRRGGLVAFPTETVYGLGADALNPLAVARIFEVKRRPDFDPLIVHIDSPASAQLYGKMPRSAEVLMDRFWPGPLTLVVPKTDRVPLIVTAGLDTVGIRMPAHPAALALIRAVGSALAAPSANPFGYVSPTEAAHVAEQFSDRIDLILDGGQCSVGVESTIVSLSGRQPRLLRPGGISAEEIRELLGSLDGMPAETSLPESPGQLVRHYATRTPLEILDEDAQPHRRFPEERIGLLAFRRSEINEGYAAVEVLSELGDLREAAANLFSALRKLDALNLDRLVARRVPHQGIGEAIMDRLRRCSARG